jgi:transcription elongation factor Elf1
MALEYMLNEMIGQLNDQSATKPQIKRYQALWDEAVAHPGYVLPCPRCYLKGRSSRLKSVSDEGVVVCEACGNRFEYDNPEAGN